MIGSTVYAGGNFTTINSTARTRLAAVNGTTGALVSGWTPSADDEVTSLAAATDGSKVFVGGLFSHIGSSSQNHVAALNPSTGATLSWAYHPIYPVEGMTATSSSLFLAGGGSGGRVGALSASSGALQWEISVDGNVQGVAVTGSNWSPAATSTTCATREQLPEPDRAPQGARRQRDERSARHGVASQRERLAWRVRRRGDLDQGHDRRRLTKAGGLDQAHFAQFSVS